MIESESKKNENIITESIDNEVVVKPNFHEVYETFDDMGLKSEILRGIYSYGFEKPSAIQQTAIVPCKKGNDVIAQAQSGTGKTATFSISILERIDPLMQQTQALVLAPTRELAQQIQKVITALGMYLNIKCYACVGGTLLKEDIMNIKNGVHIVVGTPGRVFDLISTKKVLSTEKIKMFVLDEADEMLSLGFQEQIRNIFELLVGENLQTILLSATMPQEVLKVTEQFMPNPVIILVKKDQLTLDGIKQYYVKCPDDNTKLSVLCDLYESLHIAQAVVFTNKRASVESLFNFLNKNDYTVSAIHGFMDQCDRETVMKEFRSGKSRVLVATDLVARGIDVQHVSLVINFHLPDNRENYIHRIGRSGRFGRKGAAINLVTDSEMDKMKELAEFYNTEIIELPKDLTSII